ncbi:saccharopine dehydrogenase family protein [Kibdelosporangium phytohabitans]|uniref:Saccharopine dehydrogenase n=1 Tax=Kibdelosporangium phytohabitans TaxID=860235 RepID=A0A0N9HWA8_9PSEU|nr:saccharopine dehydrogenase NADP-binding domain-containing protein [Kibdelosporangium phytohabitans]ALG07752.1 saccharopine dehydrogenase [Kibdelosporangium phytohabitans]MBE1471336.1 saccharopine dehydrogenase (NAD+, L-lysine-forming) [Kibdelosporangium phytohabitans]
MTWMVYGANGYTGKLVARLAVARGERPVLAGRSPEVRELAAELGLEHRIFGLEHAEDGLAGIDAVAHCAGPFSATARPMVDACLASKTHYLDITGEIGVFEEIFTRSDEAAEAGVVLLPGAGFDVVPSDCLAATLAEALPGATSLKLAFIAGGGFSPGTLKTTVEGMAVGGQVRKDGRLVTVPVGHSTASAAFPSGTRGVISLPWGDVATAYRSTGIPNITNYMAVGLPAGLVSRAQRFSAPVMRTDVAQRIGKKLVGLIAGPGEKRRAGSRAEFWGEARDSSGRTATATLVTPNSYDITADAVVRIATEIGGVEPGSHTPATAFGAGFVRTLDGVTAGAVTVTS